jgi:uncharacterized coiled-coil protein SlyX
MTMREREGLITRIRQIRRVAAATAQAPSSDVASADIGRLGDLEARVAHLEQLLEGFQDSVHRETERQGRQIAELQAQIQPSAMGAALSKDARDRGL